MVVGDTSGQVHFFAKDGIPIESYKLHKTNKVAHVEFSKRDPNIMCTAANDKVSICHFYFILNKRLGGNIVRRNINFRYLKRNIQLAPE